MESSKFIELMIENSTKVDLKLIFKGLLENYTGLEYYTKIMAIKYPNEFCHSVVEFMEDRLDRSKDVVSILSNIGKIENLTYDGIYLACFSRNYDTDYRINFDKGVFTFLTENKYPLLNKEKVVSEIYRYASMMDKSIFNPEIYIKSVLSF